jgi:DNA-binding response OmpR family regulator
MAKLAGSRPIDVKVELPSDSKQHWTKLKSTVWDGRAASPAGGALPSGSVRHQGCVDSPSPANLAGEESMPSKVLIVDDDKTTREGLAEFLEEAGYEAVAVGTFEEATRILRTAPPDLLIADVRLGPFNGLQLVISSPQPIPAIIITGFADPVLESDARRRGADYVLKPVSPARLLDLVAQKLASASRPGLGIPRRWERKPVIGGLPITIDHTPARIIDVSYGGLRFEMQRDASDTEHSLPASLDITLPAQQLSVKAKLVWENLIGDGTWMCGAALFQETPEWHGLVDAI